MFGDVYTLLVCPLERQVLLWCQNAPLSVYLREKLPELVSGFVCTQSVCVGIAGARGQRQSSDYYLVTPTIELQLTQIDSPPRLAPSRPRTSGVVSLWMNRRRVGGDVSNRLTLLVRFGESRPQPSCCRFVASDVEGCLKNFLSSGPNLPEGSPCKPWSSRRTSRASRAPMKA